MKDKIIRFIKTQWLMVWIIASALTLCTLFVSAESMITLSPMKRVLVSKDGHDVLFSSNLLTDLNSMVVNGTTEMVASYQPIYKTSKANGLYNVDLLLWNYNELDETTRYPEDINYRIDVALTNSDGRRLTASEVGNHSVTVTWTNPSVTTAEETVTLSSSNLNDSLGLQCLKHSSSGSTQNDYSVEFSCSDTGGWSLENDADICVEIIAVPTTRTSGGAYTDLKSLGRILGLRQSRSSGSNGWKANLSEQTETNSPNDFDAYNLILSGSGKAAITVSWDTTKISVNKNIFDNTNNVYGYLFTETPPEIDDRGTDNDTKWHTIIINADTGNSSQKNRNRYVLQLYKMGDEWDDCDDWDFYAYNKSIAETPNAWIRVDIP